MSNYPYILSETTLTVFIDGKDYSTDRTVPAWNNIKDQLDAENPDKDYLISLLKPITYVEAQVADDRDLTVREGHVFFGDEKVHDVLSTRLLQIMQEGFSLLPWKKFVRNLYANPSKFAQQELYDWLERGDLSITPDGQFLAYKIVRDDYKDIFSGKFDNSVGQVVELPQGREGVDDERTRTCSKGLHFCSKEYLPHYGTGPGSRVMIVKVHPKDVVSIPVDYSFAKGRTWKYEVVGEMDRELAKTYTWGSVDTDYSIWDSDDDSDYEDGWYDYLDDEPADDSDTNDWSWYAGEYLPGCTCDNCEEYRINVIDV